MQRDYKSIKNLIKKGICHYAAAQQIIELPNSVFKRLSKFINVDWLSDREILMNDKIKEVIDWDKIDNRKLIRLMTRDKYVIERLDLYKHNFSLKELIPLFIVHRDLIEHFDINLDNIGAIEAINLIEVSPAFLDKIKLNELSFTKKELETVIEKFYKNEDVMRGINLEGIDHFTIRKLLLKTGEKYINIIDTKKIKSLDWIEILKKYPELIEHCNTEDFELGDCYLLTKLVLMFPMLDYLIDKNKEKISGIGWENLLVHNLDKYRELCDYEKLSSANWEKILWKHPSMINVKKRYILN